MLESGDLAAMLRAAREMLNNSSLGTLGVPVGPKWVPGTVGFATPVGSAVIVRLDPDLGSITAQNLTNQNLASGQRVMVLLVPPHGVFIDGIITNGAWTAWTPNVVSGAGTITTLGTVEAAVDKVGRTVSWRIDISITTNGTGASTVLFSLPYPVAGNAAAMFLGAGRERATTGNMLQVYGAGSTAAITTYNNAYPAADGYALACSGSYETTT